MTPEGWRCLCEGTHDKGCPWDDSPKVDVRLCPWCEDEGREVIGDYEGRILTNGRGTYTCPEDAEHRWQNLDEQPSNCGTVALRR